MEHTDSGPVLLGSGEQDPLVTDTDSNFTMNSLESSNILVPFREIQLHKTVVLNGIAYVCVHVHVPACAHVCVCVTMATLSFTVGVPCFDVCATLHP